MKVIWGRVFGQTLIKSEPKMKSNDGDEKLKDCVNAEVMDSGLVIGDLSLLDFVFFYCAEPNMAPPSHVLSQCCN